MTQFRLGVAWLAVACGVLVGLVLVLGGAVRFGGTVMSASIVAAAALRACLPAAYVPGLVVRSRGADAFGYLALAVVTFAAFAGVRL